MRLKRKDERKEDAKGLVEYVHYSVGSVLLSVNSVCHVIPNFSRMGRLPHFPSYGAPPKRGASRRAWNSAIMMFSPDKDV